MTKPRARDLGIPFEGKTGKYNAITDVDGITGATRSVKGFLNRLHEAGAWVAVDPSHNRATPEVQP